MNINKSILYWLIPLVLFGMQVLMTFNSFNQIRFEELIESIQAPLWFTKGQVIAGTHTNIGWYAFLLLIYNLFGFTLNTAKFALLGISLVSLICQAIIVRRFFSTITGALILLTLGFSPTLLFFTSQNLHLGVGLQMVPVFILLLMLLNFRKKWVSLMLTILIFSLAMIALLFYAPFMFYIPAIAIFWLRKYRVYKVNAMYLAVALIAFLTPLIFGFLFVQNKEILIFDPQTGTGIFRGGGRLSLSYETFSQSLGGAINDFFIKAVSYHYEVRRVDFSDIGFITFIIVITIITIIYRKEKSSRFYINLTLLIIGFNLLVIGATSDYAIPGMKRSTPILASVYIVWVICWYYLIKVKVKSLKLKIAGLLVLSLLTIHHLFVYPINLAHIKDISSFADKQWFAMEDNPQRSLDVMVKKLQKEDLILDCRPYLLRFTSCEYTFIQSALESACLFNHLKCHKIKTYEQP